MHDAILLEESANMYITVVEPTLNICPGECVFTTSVTFPDSSTAVGSVQDTVVAESELSSISEVISDVGQFIIVGGLVSFFEIMVSSTQKIKKQSTQLANIYHVEDNTMY